MSAIAIFSQTIKVYWRSTRGKFGVETLFQHQRHYAVTNNLIATATRNSSSESATKHSPSPTTKQQPLPVSTSPPETPSSPSKQKLFKNLPVNPTIFEYVEKLGVGKATHARKPPRQRAPLSKKRRPVFAETRLPPLPFGRQDRDTRCRPVRVAQIITPDNASRYLDTKPINNTPEVALIGRSNVGKSTLLNAILYLGHTSPTAPAIAAATMKEKSWRNKRNNKLTPLALPKGKKATVSSKPGETKSITVYHLEAQQKYKNGNFQYSLRVVDLPGYGFSFVNEKDSQVYQDLILKYLLAPVRHLKRVLILIDARHGLKLADIEFLTLLQQKSTAAKLPPLQIVLTKCDLVPQVDLARRVLQVREQINNCLRRETGLLPVMLVSANDGKGVYELQKQLTALVRPQALEDKPPNKY